MKIAIDGPAGSGKSTIAKRIAQINHYTYIDTGAMYRAITYHMLNEKISDTNIGGLELELKKINLDFSEGKMYLNGEDISSQIRTPLVTGRVSDYAKIPIIRERMQHFQRAISENTSVVMDGRDIGTVVLKDAELKIYLVASVEERARRRAQDLAAQGYETNFDTLIKEIERRDHLDSTRDHSPLKKANDAIEIDTSELSIEEVVNIITNLIKEVTHVSSY
jgi:cytidylate kinase